MRFEKSIRTDVKENLERTHSHVEDILIESDLPGWVIVLIGTAISLYFDSSSFDGAQLEKVGYILFFIGVTISISNGGLKKSNDIEPEKGI